MSEEPLEEVIEALRRKVNALEYDVAQLQDQTLRLVGRRAKQESRAREADPADGSAAAPARKNGLPTLAQLRATGRSPFGS